MDKILSVYERKGKDNEAVSSKENESSSSRESVRKILYAINAIQKMSFGFTFADVDGEERTQRLFL
jgi:hypothetical protein